jgi:hypothetical protein
MNELTLEWLQKVVLDRYSVSYRYPGESAEKDEARLAFRAVTNVRSFVRAKLGVSPEKG